MLAFPPVSNITDGFIELTDDDDLRQWWVSYFETHYTEGERGQGPQRHGVEPLFPYNFGTSINGHVTICQEQATV